LTSAEGKYLGAQAQLAYSEIRSPINGVVTDRPVYPGEMPAAGTPLLTIMNTSRVTARAHIAQQEAVLLKAGDPATISAQDGKEIPAKVTLVSPATDPNSTTIEVWVEAQNPEGRLRPGTTVRVSMVAQTAPDALVIPASALLTSADGTSSVMVVGPDGCAHQQNVEIGIRQDNEVQIAKGLNAGDRVITVGAFGLPDNTKVEIATATSEEPTTGTPGEAQKEKP
jgi:HlyD family secretion protein